MTIVCRPWLVLCLNNQCVLQDVHIPCQICAGLRWCCLPLTNISCLKHTNLGWWCRLVLMLISLIQCTHTTYYVCMSGIILHVFVSRRLKNIHKHFQMHEDLGWYYLLLVDFTYQIKVGHDQWHPFEAHTPWVMRANLGWWCIPLVDLAWLMRASHEWCLRVDAHTPRLMREILGWYLKPKAYIACKTCSFHVRACRTFWMFSTICRHL